MDGVSQKKKKRRCNNSYYLRSSSTVSRSGRRLSSQQHCCTEGTAVSRETNSKTQNVQKKKSKKESKKQKTKGMTKEQLKLKATNRSVVGALFCASQRRTSTQGSIHSIAPSCSCSPHSQRETPAHRSLPVKIPGERREMLSELEKRECERTQTTTTHTHILTH